MGVLDYLLRAEQKIQRRIDDAFGTGAARTPLEIRRAILDEIEGNIQITGRGKLFPFGRIAILLQANDDTARAIMRAAFFEEPSLKNDIRRLLLDSGCHVPEELEIEIDFMPASAESEETTVRKFRLELSPLEERKSQHKRKRRQPSEVEFVVLKGAAEETVFRALKGTIYIGRLKEILDKEGQLIRRNDLAFLDNGDEINATVGRAHATVHFDEEQNEFRIIDEVSKYGTRIFRDNRSIEVPGGNPRGIKLRSGDEIYFGRACVRFNSPPQKPH